MTLRDFTRTCGICLCKIPVELEYCPNCVVPPTPRGAQLHVLPGKAADKPAETPAPKAETVEILRTTLAAAESGQVQGVAILTVGPPGPELCASLATQDHLVVIGLTQLLTRKLAESLEAATRLQPFDKPPAA